MVKITSNICEVLNCYHQDTYSCNLAGTDYKFPEDDTTVSKHVGAV